MKTLTITSFGRFEGLEIRDVPDAPRASLDRVRVRVHAAGLNRADILQRLGRYPAPPGYPQDIPGIEFAGEVEEVGDEAREWKIGDRVVGVIGGGGKGGIGAVSLSTHRAQPPKACFVPRLPLGREEGLR